MRSELFRIRGNVFIMTYGRASHISLFYDTAIEYQEVIAQKYKYEEPKTEEPNLLSDVYIADDLSEITVNGTTCQKFDKYNCHSMGQKKIILEGTVEQQEYTVFEYGKTYRICKTSLLEKLNKDMFMCQGVKGIIYYKTGWC